MLRAARRANRWAGPGYALALTGLILGTLLRPGYLLLRDAVSTPRSYLSDTALGLGESAPRAVPQDFAVALGSHVVDGGIVVKLLLGSGLWLAGCGAARLVAAVLPQAGLGGQFVAITIAIWNPYVAERLLQGHWSLLVGYGCLPWVAVTTLALRSDRRAGFGVAFWLALAGLTPTGLLLGVTVALACLLAPGDRPRWSCAVTLFAVAAVAALPWLTASALATSQLPPAGSGAAAFAARAEPGLGTLGSLAGLGGIWNAEAVPASRATPLALVATLVLVAVLGLGLPVVLRLSAGRPLLVLAAAAVLCCAALATGPGLGLLRAVLEAVPGLGVLRDTQKWVALAMPGYALAGAGAVVTLRRLRPAAVAATCCTALIVTLFDLSWGVGGALTPVRYPAGWPAAAAAINTDPGAVAVLPADGMRRFSWAGPAPVLDPLPRWVRADVLTTGDLSVDGHIVPGEGAASRKVQALLLSGGDPVALARAGVCWVVVESGTHGEMGFAAHTLARLPVVHRDADLTLYRVGGDSVGASASQRRAALTAHVLWLAMLVVGGTGIVGRWLRATCVSSAPSAKL